MSHEVKVIYILIRIITILHFYYYVIELNIGEGKNK